MATLPIKNDTMGLRCWLGQPNRMPQPHRHSEIELNYLQQGTITYLHGDSYVNIANGSLVVFWAAIPHQLVMETDCIFYYITLPLETFLHWKLPENFTKTLLSGRMLIETGAEQAAYNRLLFQHWHEDLAAGRSTLALMEIAARLWRMATLSKAGELSHPPAQPTVTDNHAQRMARFITEFYAEPLTVQRIAASVGLHPNYAMQVFKKAFYIPIGEYLTQYRIAQAQRLLAMTDENVIDIALQIGFGSNSNFYVAFKRHCGQTPTAYRQALRAKRQTAGPHALLSLEL